MSLSKAKLSRRKFLTLSGAALATATAASSLSSLKAVASSNTKENPVNTKGSQL